MDKKKNYGFFLLFPVVFLPFLIIIIFYIFKKNIKPSVVAIFAQENKLFPLGKPDSCSGRAQPHFVLDPTLKMLKTKLCRCFLKLGKTKQLAIENRFFLLGDEHTVKLKLYILREREKNEQSKTGGNGKVPLKTKTTTTKVSLFRVEVALI